MRYRNPGRKVLVMSDGSKVFSANFSRMRLEDENGDPDAITVAAVIDLGDISDEDFALGLDHPGSFEVVDGQVFKLANPE